MARHEIRVTMSRDLYREIAKSARAENRKLAEWIRLACTYTLARRSTVIDALTKAKELQS